ncbi:hypothetical protein DU99_02630 [Sinorhizobium meliloti]|nr:hypothetical protein DU99_02630 [Sinorhizobium meliloti]
MRWFADFAGQQGTRSIFTLRTFTIYDGQDPQLEELLAPAPLRSRSSGVMQAGCHACSRSQTVTAFSSATSFGHL